MICFSKSVSGMKACGSDSDQFLGRLRHSEGYNRTIRSCWVEENNWVGGSNDDSMGWFFTTTAITCEFLFKSAIRPDGLGYVSSFMLNFVPKILLTEVEGCFERSKFAQGMAICHKIYRRNIKIQFREITSNRLDIRIGNQFNRKGLLD